MPFLPLDGCELYYETHGSGPALIFAHGLGGTHLSWWQQVPAFRDRYTCVTFDHRGFGLSVERAPARGPAAFVDDLDALIDHLGFADVRLVAQSMGGWTCMGYALRRPERVRALVLACTPGTVTHPELERITAAAREQGRERRLFERGIHPAGGERLAREQPALHFLYQEVNALSPALDKERVRSQLHALRRTPPEALRTLTMPVLCLTGEEDVVIPSEAIALVASLLPNAHLVRVPEAGHSVYWERPEHFNAQVAAFLDEAAP